MTSRLRVPLLAALVLVAGCYTLKPVAGPVPDVGNRVAFDVNDVGRVALGGAMGPEIARIEGLLVQKDTGYVLAVSGVQLLRGGTQVWSGEQVSLKPEFLTNVYERKFSLGRTLTAGVVGIGGFVAFLATRSLLGSGSSGDPTPGDSVDTRIGRLP